MPLGSVQSSRRFVSLISVKICLGINAGKAQRPTELRRAGVTSARGTLGRPSRKGCQISAGQKDMIMILSGEERKIVSSGRTSKSKA